MFDPAPRPSAEIEIAYAAWAERLVAAGWTPYFLTFMFRPIGGSPATVAAVMQREVERVYRRFVTRVVRRPTAPSSVGCLPIWFCSPDRPVPKHARACLRDVIVNDGAHMHAIAFQPPVSRLREPLDEHFLAAYDRYIRPGSPLDRLDVEPISHRVGYVTRYGRKTIARGLVGEDVAFILPRARHELTPGRVALA